MSRKIYFAGSIAGGRQDADLYGRIVAKLQEYGEVLSEIVGTPNVGKGNSTLSHMQHRVCVIIVIVLASSEVHRGFESRSDQTKDYIIDICCFFAKHTTIRSKINKLG